MNNSKIISIGRRAVAARLVQYFISNDICNLCAQSHFNSVI